jgi:hypothetical protein
MRPNPRAPARRAPLAINPLSQYWRGPPTARTVVAPTCRGLDSGFLSIRQVRERRPILIAVLVTTYVQNPFGQFLEGPKKYKIYFVGNFKDENDDELQIKKAFEAGQQT